PAGLSRGRSVRGTPSPLAALVPQHPRGSTKRRKAMASRGVPRTHTEKQALKSKTRKAERQLPQIEGRRRDFVNDIEFNNAATGGHADEPIPTTPNSRSAIADAKRAAAKGAGVMSLSKKIDPEIDIAGVRATQDHLSARSDGTKT